MKRILAYVYCAALVLMSKGCTKETFTSNIPLVDVNIFIYPNTPSFINLNNVGGFEYITGGVRGIIVYRASADEFKAYDRNCTFRPEENCATVDVNDSNIIAEDDCCSSQFLITEGSPINGPATLPLKAYRTTYDGNVLHVFN